MRELPWLAADWPVPDGVVAGCTLRAGGVSSGHYASLNLGAHVGDADEAVLENRRRFVDICGLPGEPAWLSQVHGSRLAVDPTPGTMADAVISGKPDVVCAVMVADCLPVLVAAVDGSEIAAAHAGWRGLAAGVLENTLSAFHNPPERLLAWLGPAISQPAFEVGDDVRDAFTADDEAAAACFEENEAGRWQADLYGLARRRLSACGIGNVYGGGLCTYGDHARFFSYRRDGQCGRMAALIFRRAGALEKG